MAVNIDRLVAARVAGLSLAETAAAAGCSVSTVQRQVKVPDVQALIEAGRRDVREAEIREWTDMQGEARGVLRGLLASKKEDVRLRAAVHVLRISDDAQYTLSLVNRQAAIDEVLVRESAAELAPRKRRG